MFWRSSALPGALKVTATFNALRFSSYVPLIIPDVIETDLNPKDDFSTLLFFNYVKFFNAKVNTMIFHMRLKKF